MVRLVENAAGKQNVEDTLLFLQGGSEVYYGRLKSARELFRRAVELASRNQSSGRVARLHAAASVNEAYLGDSQHARADVDAALKLDPNRDLNVTALLPLALSGDVTGAERVAAELDRDYPQDTGVRHYYLPAMRAAVALQGKHPGEAVEALGELRLPRELGTLMSLDPIYLRGQAYLRLHNGSAAATEFQKIIDHPGLVGFYPVGALVHLGLGRAYALQGDAAKALAAYKDFLTLWKDADPDIPILKEAKAEYAKLK